MQDETLQEAYAHILPRELLPARQSSLNERSRVREAGALLLS